MLESALALAGRGWAVFPLHAVTTDPGGARRCDCRNPDCDSPGKHPWVRGGFKSATTEPGLIEQYWKRWPRANIGVATGAASGGLLVFDVDPRHGGDAALDDLARTHTLPDTVEVLTGGGGRHLYLATNGAPVRSKTGVWPGIDVKAEGGYVVAPPSVHASGARYEWEASSDPFDGAAVQPAPEWLTSALEAPAAAGAALPDRVAEGGRNSALASLAGSLRKRGCSADVIATTLGAFNAEHCAPPLPREEVEAIARSVGRYAPDPGHRLGGGEIVVTPPGGGGGAAPPPTLAPPPPAGQTRTTDMGNAQRLVNYHGEDLRYVAEWARWLVWEGRRWRPDLKSLRTMELAKSAVRQIYAEAASCTDDAMRDALAKWAHASESARHLNAMITLARSIPPVPMEPDRLDADPDLLNVANGLLDLRSLQLRDHDRAAYCSKLATPVFDPAATCPIWESFVADVTAGDVTLQHYLRRVAGYTLSGHTSEHVLFLLHGSGRNGKSTWIRTLQALMGDYSRAADPAAFMARKRDSSSASGDIARLANARIVAAVETDEGQRLAEGLVKQLTGEDTISARFLYAEAFEFVPAFKLFLAANHKPAVRGTDMAIWRRIHLVPFVVQIPEERVDPALPTKLRGELSGILNWALDGLVEWREGGLRPPAIVQAATSDYRYEQDVFGAFLEDCTEDDAAGVVMFSDLYRRWQKWCEEHGERAWSQKVLGSKLVERGFERGRHPATRTKCYRGLTLRSVTDASNYFHPGS